MVESGLIDKYTHALDMERAVYDTIMLDNAVQAGARLGRGARRRHADPGGGRPQPSDQPDRHHRRRHDEAPKAPLRERVGIYDKAGFPNYPARRQGRLSAARRRQPQARDLLGELARLLRDVPAEARQSERADRHRLDEQGTYEPNERYRDMPGAMLRLGNLPKYHQLQRPLRRGRDPDRERARAASACAGRSTTPRCSGSWSRRSGLGAGDQSPQLARRQPRAFAAARQASSRRSWCRPGPGRRRCRSRSRRRR